MQGVHVKRAVCLQLLVFEVEAGDLGDGRAGKPSDRVEDAPDDEGREGEEEDPREEDGVEQDHLVCW